MHQRTVPGYDEVLQEIGRLWFGFTGLKTWLCTNVHGLPQKLQTAWDKEIERAICMEIAYRLITPEECFRSGCRRDPCLRQHDLNVWAGTSLECTWREYAYFAAVGPKGMRTNSIAQGMFFSYLRELDVNARQVELKACSCGIEYEGGGCPRCDNVFNEEDTPVVGRHWLVIEGEYLPVIRWRCGRERGTPHYYAQRKCITQSVDGHTRVVHPHHTGDPNDPCDHCPWSGCPNGNPHHGQTGTTLWTRWPGAGGDPTAAPLPPPFYAALSSGVKDALDGLDEEVRRRVLEELGSDPQDIAEGLVCYPQELTSSDDVRRIKELIAAAMEEHGIGEQAAHEWLYRGYRWPTEEEVTGDEW